VVRYDNTFGTGAESAVGKTHLALSLAVRGLDLGYTVAFETPDNLMTILTQVRNYIPPQGIVIVP